ncbi:hypothetical protein CR164_08960 [Prosthecochloris marina]|uniref:Uncharacterized protein n=1 Tax=Prosthecochloris marina TaxID=2017681 RepID=A0A317T4J5_9CHLB|nr:hypothetical protein CR164_08960 [Prosthecochloris marina]
MVSAKISSKVKTQKLKVKTIKLGVSNTLLCRSECSLFAKLRTLDVGYTQFFSFPDRQNFHILYATFLSFFSITPLQFLLFLNKQ